MPRPVLVLLGLLLPPLLGVAVWAIALSVSAPASGVSVQPTNSASRAAVSATASATRTGQSTTVSATRAEVVPAVTASAIPVRVQNTASGLCQPGSGSIRGPPASQVDDDYEDSDDEYAQRDLVEGDYHIDLDLGADPANAEQLEGLGLKVRSGVYRVKDALAVIKMTPRKFNVDGTVNELDGNQVPVSSPNPTIAVSGASFAPDSTQETLGVLRGTLTVSGSLSSWMCDITAGAQGTIDTVDVYLNHGKTPVTTIPVQVTKGSGQAPRKYPFAGTFSSSVSLTAAVGPNTFTLQVRDKVIGKVGSAEIVMECRPDGIADASPSNPAPGGLTSIEQPLAASADLSGLDPAALLAGTASIPMSVAGLLADANPTATGGLTRKAKSLNGLVFAGNGMSMTVDEAGLRAALDGSAQEFSAIIDYPGMTSQPRTMVLRRNAAGKFETDVYSMEFNAPAGLEGTAPFDVTVRRGLNGPAVTATMVRDGMGWRSSDGALTMSTVLTTGPDGLRGVTASVTSSALGMSGVTVQAVESAAGNGTFGTQYVMSVGYDGEGGGTLHAQKPDLEWQDDSEKFQALALEIEGPASILESPDFKVQIRSGDRKAVKIGDKYFLANETGSDRDTLVLLPRSESVIDPQTTYFDNITENPVARSGAFLGGFLVGFAGGGCDLVSSTGKLVGNAFVHAGASLWWWFPNTPTGQYARDIVQGNVATVYSITSNTASAIVGVLSQVQARRDELEAAIVTGDRAKLKEIAGEYADLFEIGSDLVLNVIDAYADLDPYEQGKAMGHVTFELVTVVAPFAKAGKLGELTKATAVANVVNAIRAAPWLTKLAEGTRTRLLAAVGKTETFITKLATTKMCFVAGTPIKTVSGWQSIESVRPGDLVWSKSPETGVNACRAVVSTVVTHPKALFHIVYRAGNARRAHAVGVTGVAIGEGADDPPSITSELVCTGEHPFFVEEVGDFVEARNLQIGQHLIVAEGASATVVANDVEEAGDGQVFTTYNFEVAEFHTYFAGEGGVWVHNAGRECERALTLYERIKERGNLTNEAAYKAMRERLPDASFDVLRKSFVEAYNTSPNKGPGEWAEVSRTFHSEANWRYQSNISGAPADIGAACEYKISGVEFDGLVDGVLVEAKGQYKQFVDPATGEWKSWWSGKNSLVNEARRQLTVAKANGMPLEWHCMEPEVAEATRSLFAENGLAEVIVKHTP